MDEAKDLAPLDAFGRFLMVHLRDEAIRDYDDLAQGHSKAPSLQRLQRDLASLDEPQRDIVRRCLISALDSAIHNFLYNLALESDNDGRIQVTVDGVNVVELSDGLEVDGHGWKFEFSAYPDRASSGVWTRSRTHSSAVTRSGCSAATALTLPAASLAAPRLCLICCL
jgi:hypothetical protein